MNIPKLFINTPIAIIGTASLLSCSKDLGKGVLGTPPVASFKVEKVNADINTFLCTSTTEKAFNWQWSSPENNPVNGKDSFKVYYPEAGSYRVHMLALTDGGTDTTSQLITIDKDDSTVFSEGFTDSKLYLTDPDNNIYFSNQNFKWRKADNRLSTIEINEANTFQSIEGFGFTLTGGSAILLQSMNTQKRNEVLNKLFATNNDNIGISYLRLSIGASDLNDKVFTYDDLSNGQTDPQLLNFNLGEDQKKVIPILKEILAINPTIKIIATPWSAPAWMKDNNSLKGGSLKPEYFNSYAQYFVKYIQAMKANGITIDAITPQNEPLNADNNPSMYMTANDQASFVQSLGKVFSTNNITSKIIVWDHNADNISYPLTVYQNSDANKYVDGAAFHLYAGSINALSSVHDQFPSKNIYFTEQWVGGPSNFKGDYGWHMENVIIGSTRNWSKNALEWNLASDPEMKLHTDGGCSNCLGAITINKDDYSLNTSYYIIAAASKFVRPNSIRISSNTIDNLPNVAFKTPDNHIVLIVLNNGGVNKSFNIKYKNEVVQAKLNSGASATFIWKE